ncbi:MAG: FAD-binding oxidoreductase [Bacteroidota bacterium]
MKILKRILFTILSLLAIVIITLTIIFFSVTGTPETVTDKVNDISQLNSISVDRVVQPTSVSEIIDLVKNNAGPISIGGARHSMGGQIGTEGSLHLDMRKFDSVTYYNREERLITVQTGITWRKIQEKIDGDNLSVRIMQSYADFTVGGSLSVNVHGRYIGEGPIIFSVKSIRVVLADGSLVDASRDLNQEIFFGCIGGYGGLGVIVEATLSLTDNCKVKQQSELVDLNDYPEYFFKNIRNDTSVIFHNADIYPDDDGQVRATSYIRTGDPVTISERLVPAGKSYRVEQFAMWIVSEVPGGKTIRRKWADPIVFGKPSVRYRNYEASADAHELEPVSRKNSTYVLQEYFVPVDEFKSFVPEMLSIFHKNDVNLINISIRHARQDTSTLMSWAKTEVFAFVVYYKQGTTDDDKNKVGEWTRQLVDAAVAHHGSYYLPYQLHATEEQFHKAYPNATKFFELKKKLDPANKFRNKLWDRYLTL